MELDEIRVALLVLHNEVTQLLSEALRPRSPWTLIIRRRELRRMESRLDALFQRFAVLDSQLLQHTKLPTDVDVAVRTTATFNLYAAVREAVRSLLADTHAALGSLRNQIAFHSSLALAVIGLVVAIGLIITIVSLFV